MRAGVEIVPERAVIEDPHTIRLLGSDRSSGPNGSWWRSAGIP